MIAADLTGKQRRHLRALGHSLRPVVQIGHGGVTPAVSGQLDAALEKHELVKVKVGRSSPEKARDLAAMLAASTRAALAQVLGNTVLVYRRRKKDPAIVLPERSA